jgi:hypothetical protein
MAADHRPRWKKELLFWSGLVSIAMMTLSTFPHLTPLPTWARALTGATGAVIYAHVLVYTGRKQQDNHTKEDAQ